MKMKFDGYDKDILINEKEGDSKIFHRFEIFDYLNEKDYRKIIKQLKAEYPYKGVICFPEWPKNFANSKILEKLFNRQSMQTVTWPITLQGSKVMLQTILSVWKSHKQVIHTKISI